MSTFPDEQYEPYSEPRNGSSAMAPPHSLEAEQGVLGAILLSDKTHYEYLVQTALTPDDFYRDRHRIVFETMFALYEENEPIDVLTVTEHLRSRGKLDEAGGPAEIDALAGAVPSVGNIRRYGSIVKEHALLRRLLTTTYEIQAAVHGHEAEAREIVERAETRILEVAHDDRAKDFVPVGDVLHAEIDVWQKIATEGITMTGTPSGFPDLDEMTGGFQPGNLIILAARPSMGKSALVTNIAENVALHKSNPKAVALFSLEMSEGELAQRFIASQASIKGDDLRKGKLKKERDWKRVLETAARYDAAKLYIDDSSDIGLLEIRAKARRLHQQHPLGLIIVDYLQLMRADGRIENRVQQVSAMSRGLKILARELLCPVIALSQLSRGVESRTDKRPMLSDLRECVTGDTLVTLADGRRVPIAELVGTAPEVVALDGRDQQAVARAQTVWSVGVRPVFDLRLASGRSIRASADHRIRTGLGWQKLGAMTTQDVVAVSPRHHRAEQVTPASYGTAGSTAVLEAAADLDTILWDRVVSIEPAGEEEVYDLTVPGPHCWLADGIVSHNSGGIEQDADLVMFIYRDEYYYPETTEAPGEGELIIAKHRNGGLGTVHLNFQGEYPRFLGQARED